MSATSASLAGSRQPRQSGAAAEALQRPALPSFHSALVGWLIVASGLAIVTILTDVAIRSQPLEHAAATARLLAATSVVIAGVVGSLALLERRRRELRRRRWAFGVLTAAVMLLYIGQLPGYVVTSTWSGRLPSWVEDAPCAVGLPLLAIGLVALSWPPRMTRRDMLVVAGDGVLCSATLAAVWVVAVLPASPVATSAAETAFRQIELWVQLVLLVAVLVAASVSRRTGALAIRQLILLQCAALLYLASDILADLLPRADDSGTLTWSVLGYVLAVLLLVLFARRPALEVDQRSSSLMRDVWSSTLPFLPLPVATAVVIWYRLVQGPLPVQIVVYLALGLLLLTATNIALRLVVVHDRSESSVRKASAALREGTKADWFGPLVGDSRDLVTVVDRHGVIVYQTPSITAMLGYGPEDLVGRHFADIARDQARSDVTQLLLRSSHDDQDRGPHELILVDAQGRQHDTETVVAPLRTDGEDGFVLTTRDVSDRRRLRAELVASGMRDGLTRLANREGFLVRLRDQLSTLRPADMLAVALFDLEAFRDLNDGWGHEAGEEVLRTVAAALDRLPQSVPVVGRVGGDEFGFVVVADAAEAEVGRIDRELRDALRGVLLPEGSQVEVGFALGYAVLAEREVSASELMERADLAMAAGRTARGRDIVRYDPAMRSTLVARLRAEADLRDALDHDRLVVHYQPVVRLSDGRLESVEALARMRGVDGELVAPTEFIPRAEELGLIRRVGQQVLVRALRDVAAISQAVGRDISVAVNVSGHQLDDALPAVVGEALTLTHTSARNLILELTESVLAENQQTARSQMRDLRRMGCRVALDDFGTGYSSLSYLAELPVDLMKIDGAFVGNLGSSAKSFALVRTLLQLAQTLGLATVAEGVETIEQADILRGMNCERAQGYLYSRPLSLPDLLLTLQVADGVLPLLLE